ncbi:cell division protein FtsL [Lactococcus lactis]|uniref:cell division protein FtsL n=1 Tax=Lactococcus lactis TaxID=1358 RepID=UPI00034BA58F|nr:cell division protein FtsL [Lactococcus lactis]ATY87460.1 cell division protein FtsL [Lactococcus lactis subsp. lactis]ATZ01007.1 cell division protein FtsL [Lactococcus lactis subsp. lactis]QOK50944.1 cell division protein FtsL [Lactococcus lactis]
MAAQPKEYFDIETAAKKDSYLIDTETLALEVLASKFKKFSGVEKVFYLTMVVAALVLAVGLLYVKTKTLEVQGNTMDLRSKISQETTRKTEYDQQILDLTSGTKVLDTANKADLKQNPSNVLKATK